MPDYKEILDREEKFADKKIPAALMSLTDIAAVQSYLESHPQDRDVQKLNNMINTGDFSLFETLPQGLVNYYASVLIREHLGNKPEGAFSPEDAEERTLVERNQMNPFFRVGMDLAANTDSLPKTVRDNCRAMDVYANGRIMQDTLAPAAPTQIANLLGAVDKKGRPLSPDTVKAKLREDRLTQITMAKTLFLAHLGDFQVTQAKSGSRPYGGSVTDALAHGGRTIFVFGKGRADAQNTISQAVFHDAKANEYDNGTSVQKRIFATHGMTVKSGGADPANYKETSPLTSVTDNFMMNPAIGGLGNRINNDKTILNSGNNGHVYLKKVESTQKEGGYLMIGIEAEEGGEVGALGHHHTMLATPANLSAFAAPKGGPGAKTGGRIVDLSAWDPNTLGTIINAFGEQYSRLSSLVFAHNIRSMDGISAGEVPEEPQAVREAREKLNAINEKLAGKVMAPEEMLAFMRDELGITQVNCPGAGGGTVPSSVEDLLGRKAGKNGFEKLNRKAKNKIPDTQEPEKDLDKLMKEESFEVGRSFENMAKGLDHNKKKILGLNSFFGYKRKDSPEMKAVKKALRKIVDLSRKGGGANAYESREALNDLVQAADGYLHDEDKNKSSARYELVKRIRAMANSEHSAAKRVELGVRIREGMHLEHYEVNDRTKDVILGMTKEQLTQHAQRRGLNEKQVGNLNRLFDNAERAGAELTRQIHSNATVRSFDGTKDIVAFNIMKNELLKEGKEPVDARLGDMLKSEDTTAQFTELVGKLPKVRGYSENYVNYSAYMENILNADGLKKMAEACTDQLGQCYEHVENNSLGTGKQKGLGEIQGPGKTETLKDEMQNDVNNLLMP